VGRPVRHWIYRARWRSIPFGRMGDSGQWCCRVCGFERWHVVTVKRKNGALYTTSFYACSGCSAMFLSPDQFSAHGAAAPNVELPRVVTLSARRRR
jgi:hypothetical protein